MYNNRWKNFGRQNTLQQRYNILVDSNIVNLHPIIGYLIAVEAYDNYVNQYGKNSTVELYKIYANPIIPPAPIKSHSPR